MLIIGEKINTAMKLVRAAVAERDARFLQDLARAQEEAGADYVDLSVATEKGNEFDKESMEWAVESIQEVVHIPLSIDSPDPEALKAGLRKSKGKAMINSVSAEQQKLDSVLPLAKEFDCDVVALAMWEGKIPPDVEGRLRACEKIAEGAQKHGIALDKLYFDPLSLSLAADTSQGIVTLETLKRIKAAFPEARTILGLSNISFGLPGRPLINRSFLLMALYAGLDAAILDPLDRRLMSSLKAGEMALGRDRHCRNYLKAYREGLFKD